MYLAFGLDATYAWCLFTTNPSLASTLLTISIGQHYYVRRCSSQAHINEDPLCFGSKINVLYLVDVEEDVTVSLARRQGRVAALHPLRTPAGELRDPISPASVRKYGIV